MNENKENNELKTDFYEILGVSKNASLDEMKKKYKKLAILVHPDKNPSDPIGAKEKFQLLSLAMETLSDPRKKKLYDQLGIKEYLNYIKGNQSSNETYNYETIYKKFTTDDIDQYEVQYIGSKEEVKDILFFYEKCRGDMSQIIEYVPFSSSLHIIRYKEIIDIGIENKKIEKYENFVKDSENGFQHVLKKLEKLEKESIEEPKEEKKEKKIVSIPNLSLENIRQKEQERYEAMITSMELKYITPNQKRKFKEPSEEEFQKIQEQLKKNYEYNTKNKKKKS